MREKTARNLGVGAFGVSYDGSLKASNSSSLISHKATINMPRGLYNVDVVATFGVPLTTVGDLDVLIKDIEAAAGASAKGQPKVKSNFCPLVPDLVFDGVNISITRKVVEKRLISWILLLLAFLHLLGMVLPKKPSMLSMNEGRPGVMYTNDDFQTVSKKKTRKGKSKSTNGGQFAGPLVKQNVRYEPKATTSEPKNGATNV
nr:hypothetical protein [Tanacetum cinerariifolium]